MIQQLKMILFSWTEIGNGGGGNKSVDYTRHTTNEDPAAKRARLIVVGVRIVEISSHFGVQTDLQRQANV